MQKIGLGIFWLLIAGMLFFTASRTVSFIQATLPQESHFTGYFALAAFDVGIIAWAVVFQHVAKGSNQKAIALTMVIVSFLGLAAAFLADTWIESAKNRIAGKADENMVSAAIWVTSIIVLAHVAAGVAFHLFDPKLKKERDDEKWQAMVEDEARKIEQRDIKVLAAKLAPLLSQHTTNQLNARYMSTIQEPQVLPAPPKKDISKTEAIYFSADGGDNETEQEEAGPDNWQSPFRSIAKRLKGQ